MFSLSPYERCNQPTKIIKNKKKTKKTKKTRIYVETFEVIQIVK